jgi:hypothetical protein
MKHKKFPCLFLLQRFHIHFSNLIYIIFQDLLISTIHKYSTLVIYICDVLVNKKLQGYKMFCHINVINNHQHFLWYHALLDLVKVFFIHIFILA